MRHLDDGEFAGLLSAGTNAEAEAHLSRCGVCAAEVERMRAFVAGFRAALGEAAERAPVQGYSRPAATARGWIKLAAAFAALVMLAAVLLQQAPPQSAPAAVAQSHKDVSDDLLLLEVANDISSTGPEALAPASLIVEARNQQAQDHAKETR